jgi:tetratricopeptide (TPR) repeat protein
LGTVLQNLCDYDGAKSLFEKALQSNEKNFGKNHPSTARTYSNLALVLQDLGEYQKALELSGKSLAILKRVLPEGHPNIKIVSEIYQSIKNKIK